MGDGTELMPRETKAAVPYQYNKEAVALIKRTVAVGATDAELELFLYTAKRTGLDPLLRQIHAVKRWNSAQGREVMAIQTGIDGYRLIAARTGELAGIDDAVYAEENGIPVTAKVAVYRVIGGIRCPFTATARWSEYVQIKKDGEPTSMWQKMPYLMLGKCAEALALRKAFPAELSGLYTHEEMQQADNESTPLVITQEAKAQVAETDAAVKKIFHKPQDEPTPIHHYCDEKPDAAQGGDLLKQEYDGRLEAAQNVKDMTTVMNEVLDSDLPVEWKKGFEIRFKNKLAARKK